MTFDGIRRLSPYWSLALCYGVVTAVGLIPGLLYGNEFAYWLLGFGAAVYVPGGIPRPAAIRSDARVRRLVGDCSAACHVPLD